MRIRLYGRLADGIGREVEITDYAMDSVAAARRTLAEAYPAIADTLARSRACLENELVGDDHRLGPGRILEFLPPVSGG